MCLYIREKEGVIVVRKKGVGFLNNNRFHFLYGQAKYLKTIENKQILIQELSISQFDHLFFSVCVAFTRFRKI